MGTISRGCGREANMAWGEAECYICLKTTPMCNIFPWYTSVSDTLTGYYNVYGAVFPVLYYPGENI